jgi:hypothetical protein
MICSACNTIRERVSISVSFKTNPVLLMYCLPPVPVHELREGFCVVACRRRNMETTNETNPRGSWCLPVHPVSTPPRARGAPGRPRRTGRTRTRSPSPRRPPYRVRRRGGPRVRREQYIPIRVDLLFPKFSFLPFFFTFASVSMSCPVERGRHIASRETTTQVRPFTRKQRAVSSAKRGCDAAMRGPTARSCRDPARLERQVVPPFSCPLGAVPGTMRTRAGEGHVRGSPDARCVERVARARWLGTTRMVRT